MPKTYITTTVDLVTSVAIGVPKKLVTQSGVYFWTTAVTVTTADGEYELRMHSDNPDSLTIRAGE